MLNKYTAQDKQRCCKWRQHAVHDVGWPESLLFPASWQGVWSVFLIIIPLHVVCCGHTARLCQCLRQTVYDEEFLIRP
jgi:hypothetical protein